MNTRINKKACLKAEEETAKLKKETETVKRKVILKEEQIKTLTKQNQDLERKKTAAENAAEANRKQADSNKLLYTRLQVDLEDVKDSQVLPTARSQPKGTARPA